MFRPIAETLTLPSRLRLLAPSARLTPLRRRSDRALPPPDAAADLDPEPPAAPPPPPPSADARHERQFHDFLRDVIVRQSAPDWLPFIPGSSYWVPPIDMKLVKEIPAQRMKVMRLLHGLHSLRPQPTNDEGEGENDSEEPNTDSDGLDSELEQD